MRLFFILPLIFVCQYCFSQFNDSTHYYINFSSAGIINKTALVKSYVLTNSLKFNVSKKNYSLNSTTSWIYGRNEDLVSGNDVLTNNDFSSALDFNIYTKNQRLYYWGLGGYDKSLSLKINHRVQLGAGVGYNIVNRPNSVVVISDGFIYEKGNLFINNEFGNDVYETVRNSLRLKFRFVVNEILVIDGSDFYQPSLADPHDYIIKSNTNLSVKLKKWLNLTTSLTYNKVSRTQSENLLINFGITIERWF